MYGRSGQGSKRVEVTLWANNKNSGNKEEAGMLTRCEEPSESGPDEQSRHNPGTGKDGWPSLPYLNNRGNYAEQRNPACVRRSIVWYMLV